ncbi:MAG: hypothetical protein LC797_15875, partial [Chloroflexi bacterium]|nr:hypothetical protein [Chloroflexota bacterium]
MARVSDAASLDLARPRLQPLRLELISVLGTLLLLIVGGLVLFPLGLIVFQSFTVPIAPGQTQLG